ncbi:hypothetical protein ACFLTA_02960 [Bacteroidota bacterium]
MNYPLIHIGYPKTGTTWFQQRFYPNVKDARFIPRIDILDQIIRPYAIDFDTTQAVQYFHTDGRPRILICEERLMVSVRSGGFNGFVMKELGNRLKTIFPEARIIIFIRNQVDMIASAYGQYIKEGGRSGIDDYLYHPKAGFYPGLSLFSFQYLEYDRILSFYQGIFGDNLFIFPYERFSSDRITFLTDFTRTFQLDINLESLDFSRVNERYHSTSYMRFRNYLRIPRKINMSLITRGWMTHKILFSKKQSSESILGKKNTEFINHYYRKSNQRLLDIFDMKEIRELGYPL